jgi:hypothetical protein
LRDCVLTSRKGFKGRLLPYLAYQSVGVIYGEIGTNPHYVYSSTFMSEPSHEDLVGVLSGKEVSMLLSNSGKIVYTKPNTQTPYPINHIPLSEHFLA